MLHYGVDVKQALAGMVVDVPMALLCAAIVRLEDPTGSMELKAIAKQDWSAMGVAQEDVGVVLFR